MSDAILHAGIQGVQGGLDQFGRAAGLIASSTTGITSSTNQSVTDGLVEVKQAQRSVEVSAKVISAADSTVSVLLDELA